MFKRFMIIGGILAALVLGVVVWGVVSFRRHPLQSLVKLSRLSLRLGGGERHTIDAPAGKLVYWTIGEGPTVFLIHGANDQAGLWSKSVARLKGTYRFVIPDMPGHGESDPATGPLDLEMMVAAVEALGAKESPDEPMTLVGNSLGGWVELLYTLDHPARVRRLVLEDGGGIAYDEMPNLVPASREEARTAFNAALSRDDIIPDFILDDFVRRAPTSQAARLARVEVENYFLDDRLDQITVPVTLIWGEDDGVLKLEYAKRLESLIAGAELHTIVGCGHVPHNECPDEFAKLLDDALKETRHVPR